MPKMTNLSTQGWLDSFRQHSNQEKAIVWSILSGKGGVGKSTTALKISLNLAKSKRVLYIDADANLSNGLIKLGINLSPQRNYFNIDPADVLKSAVKFQNLYILSGANGSLDFFELRHSLDSLILELIDKTEKKFDYIFIDCPAGMDRTVLEIASKSSHRLFVINPDRSSITDSYSVMKILKHHYSIGENHFVLNRVDGPKQGERVSESIQKTCSNFIDVNLNFLGQITNMMVGPKRFDEEVIKGEKSSLEREFAKLSEKLVDSSHVVYQEQITNSIHTQL